MKLKLIILSMLALSGCATAPTGMGEKLSEQSFQDDCSDPECIDKVVTFENGKRFYRFDGTVAAEQKE